MQRETTNGSRRSWKKREERRDNSKTDTSSYVSYSNLDDKDIMYIVRSRRCKSQTNTRFSFRIMIGRYIILEIVYSFPSRSCDVSCSSLVHMMISVPRRSCDDFGSSSFLFLSLVHVMSLLPFDNVLLYTCLWIDFIK